MQERLRDRPWALLVGCVLYARVQGERAWPVLEGFLAAYPTHEVLRQEIRSAPIALKYALRVRFKQLGLGARRAQLVLKLTEHWDLFGVDALAGRYPVEELPGCGRYAAESFRTFVLGELVRRPQDKELRRHARWAEARLRKRQKALYKHKRRGV